ncbi:archaemetzincin [Fulvivirga ligni]|uniref:archaemetzincin n=1 Tax=Fulvivirga ligni TaxID=2904246 RepID=UPI001F1A7495|nr:archaemetzincin [Fulvivirga ligni]UII19846.1 archaemetzincin [Fulvivirga ligni]
MKELFHLILLTMTCVLIGCQEKTEERTKIKNSKTIAIKDLGKLKHLQSTLPAPEPGEWLYQQNESGQTFQEYVQLAPHKPDSLHHKIYLQPIGTFDSVDISVLENLRLYLQIFFGQKTILLEIQPSIITPQSSRRNNHGIEQIHTQFLLQEYLPETKPQEAIAYAAITSEDLFPKEGWNYVFGQAGLNTQLSTFSMYRYKTAKMTPVYQRQYLNRLAKTASHEIGHSLGLKHCNKFKCLMNGSLTLTEADHKPSWLCYICLAKIGWNTQMDLQKRYDQLIEYTEQQRFNKANEFYKKSRKVLMKN